MNGALVAFNDNWQDTTATAIKATLLPPVATLDSAIVASLPAGNYTAIVRGKNGATGVALVEAYRLQYEQEARGLYQAAPFRAPGWKTG